MSDEMTTSTETTITTNIVNQPMAGDNGKQESMGGEKTTATVAKATNKKKITPEEKKELRALETRVKNSIARFSKVCVLLKEIHDRGTYKKLGYRNFEAYCNDRFNVCGSNVYRMFQHHRICTLLGLDLSNTSSRVTRPFPSKWNDEQIREVWYLVIKKTEGTVPTGDIVAGVVAAYRESMKVNAVEMVCVNKTIGAIPSTQLFETLNSKVEDFIELAKLIRKFSGKLTADEKEQLQKRLAQLTGAFLGNPA